MSHPTAKNVPPDVSTRQERIFEVCVFLFLIVPSMSLSFLLLRQGSLSFPITAAATILRDLALVTLIVFFLWRNGESKDQVGWRFGGVKDILLGIVLFVVVFYGAAYLDQMLLRLGFTSPAASLPKFLTPNGPGEEALAVVLVIVVAIAEEVIFRGYLILRFTEITGSTAAAILLSSAIFGGGGGGEGSAGVIMVGFLGLAFSLVYLWTGSLTAPILMHFLQDFLGIVLVPLLKHRG